MRKLIASIALGLAAFGVWGVSYAADEAASAPMAASAVEAPAASAPDAAPAPAASVASDAASAAATAASQPVPNKGDTTWMMVSTLLVILMTVPGLALFYGGLVRSKNMLSVLMQVMVTFSLIVVLWFIFSYAPIAHMVWFWMGPDAYTGKDVVDAMNGKAGLIWQWGALDFAGGTVVHINAAVAGLVGAYMVGKRIGYGKESFTPHSLTLTMVGASLLWVGWFGFNAGSALEANGFAALAFINTFAATAAAVLGWCLGEALHKGKASMLGAASGAVAGLVAITPAAGNVGIGGAVIIGALAGFICLWGVTGLKKMLGADDSLDVFGVHGVGGIFGALVTGVFNSPNLGGPSTVADWVTVTMTTPAEFSIVNQLIIQAKAVGVTVVWSAVVSIVAFKIVDVVIGLRVPEEDEREGLDITSHGETAYHK
jgi:Amt family ammonium transporter